MWSVQLQGQSRKVEYNNEDMNLETSEIFKLHHGILLLVSLASVLTFNNLHCAFRKSNLEKGPLMQSIHQGKSSKSLLVVICWTLIKLSFLFYSLLCIWKIKAVKGPLMCSILQGRSSKVLIMNHDQPGFMKWVGETEALL
jgi:hypothetical protein